MRNWDYRFVNIQIESSDSVTMKWLLVMCAVVCEDISNRTCKVLKDRRNIMISSWPSCVFINIWRPVLLFKGTLQSNHSESRSFLGFRLETKVNVIV